MFTKLCKNVRVRLSKNDRWVDTNFPEESDKKVNEKKSELPEAEKKVVSKLDIGEANPSQRDDWVTVYDAKSSQQSAMVECESIYTKMDFASVIWEGKID